MLLALEMSTFAVKDEHIRLWKRMLLALETSSFSAKDEVGMRRMCLVLEMK